jgi:regulatory protein
MGRQGVGRPEAHEARLARRATITDPEIVMEAAARLLASRSRSVSETRRRLQALGYPAPHVATVIERLERMGYLDDTAFARAWLESRDRSRPRGESALRQELRRKGLDDATVRDAIQERAAAAHQGTDADEARSGSAADLAAARRLLERKAAALVREPDPRKRLQKAYALLARNGFGPDVCREVSRLAPGIAATVDANGAEATDPGPDELEPA